MVKRSSDPAQADKHKRLAALGKASHVTMAGMDKLLKAVRDGGVPAASSRSSQYRARKHIASTMTPFGTLIQEVSLKRKDGRTVEVAIQHPLASLFHYVEVSEHWAYMVSKTMREHACSPGKPWNVVVYQDGINPGDGLAKHQARKSCAFYWSIWELGLPYLQHEESWLVGIVLRQDIITTLEGGHTQVAKVVMESFAHPHNSEVVGVQLRFPDGSTCRVFLKIGVLLADEPAIKEVLDCKGHAGTKPCLLCLNAALHGAHGDGAPLHEFSPYLVSIAEPNFALFKKHTDASLRTMLAKLHAYKSELSKEHFELREQLFGFNYNPHQLILNERLRLDVASMVMSDWCHTYICDGIADEELGSLMKAMQQIKSPTTFSELGSYVVGWKQAKQHATLDHLFSDAANRNNLKKSTFNCTASEFLALAPILARYLANVVEKRGQLAGHVESMLAVLHVIELLQAVRRNVVTPAQLAAAIARHFALYVLAYGKSAVRPKHHYALHLPDMLGRFGSLLATFVHERKHRVIKRYTRKRENLRSWELGTMEELLSHQLFEVNKPFLQSTTEAKPSSNTMYVLRELFPHVPDDDFAIHSRLSADNGMVHTGDVVFYLLDGERHVGELLTTIGIWSEARGKLWSIVTRWSAREGSRAFLPHDVHESTTMVSSEALMGATLHRYSNNRKQCVVYLPWEYRADEKP
jgi:hypothetical protein